jgi:hypothetical protein
MFDDELQIPHWSQGFGTRDGPAEADQEAPPAAKKSRLQVERDAWMASLAAFKRAWETRASDSISDEHPLAQWIARQRKLYRTKKLMPWKHELLKKAGFPFVAHKVENTPTDQEYAVQLFAFFTEHGHYAPTITIGGAGLTKWTKSMAQSNGKVGLKSGTAQSAAKALSYLKQNILGFSFAKTKKERINAAKGLTFNGYKPTSSNQETATGHGWTPRHPAMVRAYFSSIYPLDMDSISEMAPEAIQTICYRAMYYEQAVRVTVCKSDNEVWWLTSCKADSVVLSRQEGVGSKARFVQKKMSLSDMGSIHYDPETGMVELVVVTEDNNRIILDYDGCLADMTHRNAHPIDFSNYRLSVAMKPCKVVRWTDWLTGSARPPRFVSAKSTANIAFEKHLRFLKEVVAQYKVEHGENETPNVTYKEWGSVYKFLEHALLRATQQNIPPSHVERLIKLDLTWGSNHKTLTQLLVQPNAAIHGANINRKVRMVGDCAFPFHC